MKTVILAIFFSAFTFAQIDETTSNDFFDNSPIHQLSKVNLVVNGETDKNGIVNFDQMQLRKITIKESLINDKNEPEFIGAYSYYGYSIFDIINKKLVKKKNQKTFSPAVDLYITIENDKGEKIALSWGEIFYPDHLHRTIIATKVSRIIPSKSKEKWPLPTDMKLICGNDMYTYRNISNPTIITVKSFDKTFPGEKGILPIYAEDITVLVNNIQTKTIKSIPKNCSKIKYPYVFYGRGRGFHGIEDFEGYLLKDFLKPHFKNSKKNIKSGLFVFAAKDAYRCVYTFSEIFNRNDQSEFLLFDEGKNKNRGRFALFPTPDFFSDRALRSISTLHFTTKP